MTLTLAIPCHNDREPLAALLARARRLGCFDHVVVVDDGSDRPLAATALCAAAGLAPERLTLIRHETALGPGAARNRALAEVGTDHVLFLDADDLPTAELPLLMEDLAGRSFDFCLFAHHDTRRAQDRAWGQMPWDQALWERAGVALGALSEVTSEAATHLAQTANYPWNKIYRTAFLRERAIGCSEILLHEDVELHWKSFVHARTILASDRVGVIHVVNQGGDRLTNLESSARLEVFGPFARLAAETAGTPFALPFARFALGLCAWIGDHVAAAHRPRLAELTRTFATRDLAAPVRAELARSDPALMARTLGDPPA
ncbi:glycosyltransferase family 2 protein [Seohaeicola nanhaiensis]|uniref:Glycosyltransferase family 2 protein n=1 Tax=Seohaeicola nanhaiensis TaxID=1387282 RepID=A0ABV9KMB3_9RHOB